MAAKDIILDTIRNTLKKLYSLFIIPSPTIELTSHFEISTLNFAAYSNTTVCKMVKYIKEC